MLGIRRGYVLCVFHGFEQFRYLYVDHTGGEYYLLAHTMRRRSHASHGDQDLSET